jgi:MFS transporter, ACS family, D-galactonate transporter
MLMLGMIISYVDRSNLPVALASPEFKNLFNLSNTDRGLLNSAFFWSYAFLQIPAGFLVDRYGVKWTYAWGFVLWSVISAATALTGNFAQLFGMRLLLGLGEAVVTPASLRWIRFNVEEKQRGLAVGMLFAGAKFGPAVGAPLAVWLMGLYGWQGMFAILGLGALVWLIPWVALVRNDDREIEAAQLKQSSTPPVPFGDLFKTPIIWGVLIGTFCYNYFVYLCVSWLPSYFVEARHMTQKEMGLFTSFTFSGMAVTAMVAGAAADWMIRRGFDAVKVRKGFTIAGFLVASTEIIGVYSQSNQVAQMFAIVSLSGLGLATANYWALTQTLMPGVAIGRLAGVQNFASNLSGIVAAWATGVLLEKTGSYLAPMQFLLVILITGLCSYIFLVRKEYAR